MKEMKDSGVEWIGTIPTDWDTLRMKGCVQSRDGGAWGEDEKNNEDDCLCIRIPDFDRSRLCLRTDTQLTTRNYTPSVRERLELRKNDILIEKSGGGEKTPVGRSIIFDRDYPALFANFIERIRVNNLIRSKYFLYVLTAFYENNHMWNYIKQTTGIQNLDVKGLLANEETPIPRIETQDRIVDYLDFTCSQIDSIISKQEAIIERLKEYKLSVITEAVTKGLIPDAEMKDSGINWIGDIPFSWSVVPLKKYLVNIVDYRGKTPEKVEKGVFLVTAKNIKNGAIDYSLSEEYVKESDYEEIMRRGIPKVGDVLFTTEAPLGQVANVDRTDIALAQRIIKFTPCDELDPYYLKYWIMSTGFQEFLKSLSTGSTAAGIKASKLYILPLVIGSIHEQRTIVDYLDRSCDLIEKRIAKLEKSISAIQSYKKSLVYEVVTGKKEV